MSFDGWITTTGFLSSAARVIGEIDVRKARICGSRSSPYSGRRSACRDGSVSSRNATRLVMPAASYAQRMRSLYSMAACSVR